MTLEGILQSIKSFLSLDYRALFIVSGIAWITILLPIQIWQFFKLENIIPPYRPWISLIAIVSTLWLFFAQIYDLRAAGKLSFPGERKRMEKSRAEVITSASRVEKEVLAQYIAEDSTTLAFDFRDGVVNGLVSKGILYRASTGSNPLFHDFDYNIQPWAEKYLKEHPEILQGIEPREIGRHQLRF